MRLRELRSLGHHFRKQSPLAPFIVDFECRRARVVVEVDGHQHRFDEHRKKDAIRDRELAKRGYKVLRFSNHEIERELDGVLQIIVASLAESYPHPAASRPPSRGREG